MSPNVIEVDQLTKNYGDFQAVKGVSLTVATRELFGFLGPNGAGKTTTISMLTTLLKPSSGTARVAGFDVVKQYNDVRRRIGIIFQDPSLDKELTGRENLWFHGVLYGVSAKTLKTRINELIRMVDLEEFADQPTKAYSGGMKRRLEIARGLVHTPEILFLDEPTLGLDAQTRATIWEYITAVREQHQMTIFLTTHYLEETERADRVAIIDHGQIIALDSPAKLKAETGQPTMEKVYLKLTGRDLRDAQLSALEAARDAQRLRQGRGG